jgi:hypothetical protein
MREAGMGERTVVEFDYPYAGGILRKPLFCIRLIGPPRLELGTP